MRLQERVERLLLEAIRETVPDAALNELTQALRVCQRTLNEPMRVAVIGGVNNGKSTLLNALLAEALTKTGNQELTFNVSWIRHGPKRELRVHTKDSGVYEERFESLDELSSRCEGNEELLRRIKYIEVRHPAKILKHFDLIDTPGLFSALRQDSANTREFLADDTTRPHAIIFLFSDTLKAHDLQELEAFHRLSGKPITGITAIGALTKVDNMERGLETAERVIRQIRQEFPWSNKSFYTILPLMAQSGFGAQTLDEADGHCLEALSRLPEAMTHRILLDAKTFSNKEYPEESAMPAASARRRLYDRLGRRGIWEASSALRRGVSLQEAMQELLQASNVAQLREIVISHFGNRAYLVKSCAALDALRDRAFRLGERHRENTRAIAYRVVQAIDAIKSTEMRFREFVVLEKYYRENLDLEPALIDQLMEVTGEHGTSCASRLGVREETPVSELLRLAECREGEWRRRSADLLESRGFKEISRTLAQSYAAIHERLSQAQIHLNEAAALLDNDS